MVNVLQAMVLTRGPQMILTPTYHVFEMYTVHHDALSIPVAVVDAARYAFGGQAVPAVSASASRDRRGVLHVTMSNLDPNRARTVTAEVRGMAASGASVGAVTGRILTAPAMNSYNTFEQPNVVQPAPFAGAQLANGRLTVALPPRSIVVLELR